MEDQLDELMQRLDELISSGGVTRRCVSLAQGTLSPDLRVNYEFGLVLGVNEFRQEQLYFLHKEYLHNRALHGYGTVSGLRVLPEAAGSGDVKLTVTPGIGVDQCGRAFVVRNPQCAFLGAWFQRQRQQEAPNLQPGAKRLYVVATYDECPDALVAIAGQPCSSSQQSQVPSRIRDSFQIVLRWAPPAMPAWDAIQCFADLMADVRIVPDLPPSQSDKDELIALVRLLDDCDEVRARRRPPAAYGYGDGYGDASDEAPGYLYLPAATARQDLDDIFRVWVTEVRPRLLPDLIECGYGAEPGETGVLLTTLAVQLDYSNDLPVVTLLGESAATDDTGRPYLLSTQLIQELMTLGGTGGAAAPREFATLSVRDRNSLLLWVHHPEPLGLAATLGADIELFSNDTPLSGTVEPVVGLANVFSIRVNEAIAAGARVMLRFRLNAIRVLGAADGERPLPERGPRPGLGRVPGGGLRPADPAATLRELAATRAIAGSTALLASLDLFGGDYVGREGETLTIYAVAPQLPDVRDFVTISTSTANAQRPELRLWLHADGQLTLPATAVTATRLRGNASTSFVFDLIVVDAATNQWVLRPRQAVLQSGDQILLSFDSDQILLPAGQSLSAAMARGLFSYLGYDGARRIDAFHTVELVTASGGLSEEQVLELIRQVRTLSFATITPISWNRENLAEFELWFHLDQAVDLAESKIDNLNFRVYMEAPQAGQVVRVEVQNVTQFGIGHYTAQVDYRALLEVQQRQPTYARFVFPLDEGNSIGSREGDFATLREYMARLNVKFDGYYAFESERRQEVLVIYVRFDQQILGQRG